MHAEKTSSAHQQSSTDVGSSPSPDRREELPASPSSTSTRGETAPSPGNSSATLEDDDEHTQEPHPRSRRRPAAGAGREARDGETAPSEKASSKDDVTAWLSLGKQAAESKCRELEGELAEARQELAKQDARCVSVSVSLCVAVVMVVHGPRAIDA